MDKLGNLIILNNHEILDLQRFNLNKVSIWRKNSSISGEFRIRDYLFVAGLDCRETTYSEDNKTILISLDCYFDPRLVNERKHLSKTYFGKSLLVIGAGVGIFSIYLNNNFNFIHNLEINPKCKSLFEQNMMNNKIFNSSYSVIKGQQFVNRKKSIVKFSDILIIMPLNIQLNKKIIFRAKKNNPDIRIMLYMKDKSLFTFLENLKLSYTLSQIKNYSKNESIFRVIIM